MLGLILIFQRLLGVVEQGQIGTRQQAGRHADRDLEDNQAGQVVGEYQQQVSGAMNNRTNHQGKATPEQVSEVTRRCLE